MNLDTIQSKTHVCGLACKPTQLGLHHKSSFTLLGEVKDFFFRIFDTSDWPARWHCGNWTEFHGWLYIVSDVIIWACYFTIPFLLTLLIRNRKDIPFPKTIWLFGAFIVLCGFTHLIDAIIFWWPAYRLSALLRLLTAIISGITVYALYKIIPQIYSLRTVKDLEREIEERQAIDDKLAQSEFLLTEVGRMGRIGGWELDMITNKATWSKTIYEIYELPYDAIIQDHDIDSYFLEPYNKQLKDAIDNAISGGKKWDLELQMLTAKKNIIWVRSFGEPFYNTAGEIVKLRGVFMDIDKYKSNEILLNNSVDFISQQNTNLKSFTHILSHNIRNHSSNISLLSSLVDESSLNEDNAELFYNLKNVANGLHNTLEDLSRAIEIRESVVPKEALNFEAETKLVIDIIAAQLKSIDATLNFNFEIKDVFFPKVYLESIIMNLLTNAIKYRKTNTKLIIKLKTYLDFQGSTTLECSDNGIGIDLELHGHKIFGLYKTFHNNKDAHGVGLFLTKTQIESQGGEINVQSTLGLGTTFKIRFN